MSIHNQRTRPPYAPVSLSDQPPTPLPEYLGPYQILSLISQGGMGTLYLGVDPQTKGPVAVKVLPEDAPHKTLLKEAEIIRKNIHPNVVKLIGEGESNGSAFIAMEYIRGISLKHFIEDHTFTMRRALDIVLQVSKALLHLHSNGVIHRDLKPDNILITESGAIKLIDFGISSYINERSKKESSGTPSYMSPEQRAKAKKITQCSDIYSLALITYELITGKISHGHVDFELIPTHLRKILETALAQNPKERTQESVDFYTALSDYLSKGGIDSDQMQMNETQQLVEIASHVRATLLPQKAPNWPHFDFKFSRAVSAAEMGVYYDFLQIDNERFAILYASGKENSVEEMTRVAFAGGALMNQIEEPESIKMTFTRLSQRLKGPINVAVLYLDFDSFEYHFLSANGGHLHIKHPGSEEWLTYHGGQEPLGLDPAPSFAIQHGRLRRGDVLLFSPMHQIVLPEDPHKKTHQESVDAILEETLMRHEVKQPKIIFSLRDRA